MGPLQGSAVKISGHMIAYRTPLSPRTTVLTVLRGKFFAAKFVVFFCGVIAGPVVHCKKTIQLIAYIAD